ncbi:MAG: MarR family winged helix-turn-helix transcriptional regulator [Actinomycetota bacterium]|nr:MarR family winged helix-turn-helix transcriptional regulator [Actinomycetota bacterium]
MALMASSEETVLPGEGRIGLEAWKDLLTAHAHLTRGLDEELRERHSFSLGDFDVLINLANVPGQRRRMCDLASAVLLSPSGLSRRVDRLEAAGLVQRERAASDARIIETGLTADGSRLLRRLQDTHLAGVKQRFVDRFTDAELQTLHELLARLTGEDAASAPSC